MARLRDHTITILLLSALEGILILQLLPQLRPTGGLGRLAFRLFLANFGLVILYQWMIWPFFFNPLRKLPGPKGINLFLGSLFYQFERPPAEHLRKIVNNVPNDGLLYMRGMFNQPTVIPTGPETLKTILNDNPYDYQKPSKFITLLRRILGDGLILVEGDVHRFQRKHLLPSFQVKHIRALYPMFWAKSCEVANSMLTESDPGAAPPPEAFAGLSSPPEKNNGGVVLEFGQWCMRSTLDIIGIAGLGRDFDSLRNPDDELQQRYHTVLEPDKKKLFWFALQLIFPQRLVSAIPWHINTQINEIQQYLYNFARRLVETRRELFEKDKQAKETMNDIISLLVKSGDFSDDELAHQTLTMMSAGHETTSSTLSWCCYLLALNPEIQKRVRDEVRANLPSPHSGDTISAAQIDNLPVLNAVCNETTRLYPTVPVTIREAIKPTPLHGYTLPTGTVVLLSPWAINRCEHFWGKDASEFKPERWINPDGTGNNTGGAETNYALLTFLHGPRSCIGQGFARSELKCLLAAVVGRYEFELTKKRKTYFPAGLVTSKPDGGMWLRMKEVEGW
ncbi:MAG: hypothetical protein Q9162_000720 [Coniocarpon cinnabarinum]